MNLRKQKFTVILVVTNSCNLHCKYCYEHNKNSASMSLQTALKIADHELSNHNDHDVVFDLFGGEPFLEFSLIERFCNTVWSSYENRNIKFSCITNGTLLDSRIFEWLKQHRHHFFCHISLDGTPEMHRLNRGEIFPIEAVKKFVELWPDNATAKMTISKETLKDVSKGVKYLNELGLRVAPSLARGLDWNDDDLSLYRRELDKLVDYCLSSSPLCEIDLFNTLLVPVLIPEAKEKYCGAGYSICAYSPDGTKYPCQMFMPSSLDANEWLKIKDIDLRADRLFYTDDDCKVCPVKNLCTKCPGLNYKERGHFGKRDKRLCNFIKLEYQTIAKYKIAKLSMIPFDNLSKNDYIELKAAVTLLESLN